MRRLAAIAVAAVALVAFVAATTGSDDDGYRVRAIFDDAPTAVGADVQIAGVTVGRVTALDVTEDRKAAVTLSLDDARFTPLRADARCGVVPQSLIGERTISCTAGTSAAAPLREIPAGEPGAGAHLLPLARTSGTVDLDLVNAIMRRPASQQLSILLTELGAGLAARGPELRDVIHRANPGLDETDRVLKVLAAQNEELAQLATDGDRLLQPLARQRRSLSAFVQGAARTASASARERAALTRTLERLPRTLGELRPLLAELDAFASQSTPLLADLADAAPAVSDATGTLAPFARAALPTLQRLGTTADRARRDLPRAQPLAERLGTLGTAAKPPVADLDALTKSFEDGKGITNLLELGYYGTSAANGFDDQGHYLRGEVLSGACGEYTLKVLFGCDAKFGASSLADSARAASLLDYLLGPGE